MSLTRLKGLFAHYVVPFILGSLWVGMFIFVALPNEILGLILSRELIHTDSILIAQRFIQNHLHILLPCAVGIDMVIVIIRFRPGIFTQRFWQIVLAFAVLIGVVSCAIIDVDYVRQYCVLGIILSMLIVKSALLVEEPIVLTPVPISRVSP